MVDSELQREAGRRLARDLRAIRHSRSIDMKEVLDATRLADDVIEQLEESSLMGNPMFNRVYLRSMFSSYGSVLGISHSDIMTALEEAMAGTYIGSLAKYLGNKEVGSTEDSRADSTAESNLEADTGAPTLARTARKSDTVEASVPESKSQAEQNHDSPADSEEKSHAVVSEVQDAPAVVRVMVKPDERLYEKIGSAASQIKSRVLLPNMSGFLMLVFAGIVMISLVWFAISWILSPKEQPQEIPTIQDSTPSQTLERPERIVLPDTISILLIANDEALDPIRVKVDRDLRRPYWIEHRDTLSFKMLNSIEFEREVDHSRIFVSGFQVPYSWYNNEVRAGITRDQTQAWLDSLVQARVFPPRSATGIE